MHFISIQKTVIFQGLQTLPTVLAHPVSGAVGLDLQFIALQALRDSILGQLHPGNVNPVKGEHSVQILKLPESPMWRGSPAGPLINVLWVGFINTYIAHMYFNDALQTYYW